MQFWKACYTVVLYAPYILLQRYTITILATFWLTIFDFFHPGPQPKAIFKHYLTSCDFENEVKITKIWSVP